VRCAVVGEGDAVQIIQSLFIFFVV